MKLLKCVNEILFHEDSLNISKLPFLLIACSTSEFVKTKPEGSADSATQPSNDYNVSTEYILYLFIFLFYPSI